MRTNSATPRREVKFALADLSDVAADGTFSGYASLFGIADLGADVVEPGAFSRSIAERGPAGIKMLYQHDPAEPIGAWSEVREDARGLFVAGRLMSEVARGREVLALMRAGILDGLSIGFETRRAIADPANGTRRLIDVDLWEISIVTFPMLPGARVSSVKAGAGRPLPSLREFERWLTRSAGLSRTEALTVINTGFKSLIGTRDAALGASGDDRRLAEAIRRAARTIRKPR
ncbi:MAG: HK97 family phage prohead protease [Hyphomicrobiales bacterium]